MVRFGLHLTLRSGRDAVFRLLLTAAAVAFGVGLLLVTLAAVNGVEAQNDRNAWLNSGTPDTTAPDAVVSPDPLWAALRTDAYDGEQITHVDVAATGSRSPVPPGIPALPEAGQYYASPALAGLLASTAPTQLADRYPGELVGTIDDVALAGPDALVVVVGGNVDDVSRIAGASQVASIATVLPSDCSGCRVGHNAATMGLILSVTATALLIPILILIGTATRLSAARRERRFAVMRLVGATPRQVSTIAVVESTLAAVLGTMVGFAVFLVLRVPLAAVPFTGQRFFPDDLSLGAVEVLVVALGVPAASGIAAWVSMRRVRMSPLGIARQATPPAPRAWRLVPLLVGLTELAYFVGRRPDTTSGQISAYVPGIVLVMIGLVIAGPWLTMVAARVLARRTGRPEALIAARRLADDPRRGFRAISGLVLALFVTTTAVGVMSTMVAERADPTNAADTSTVTLDFTRGPQVDAVASTVTAELRARPGVAGVVLLHENPLGLTVPVGDWQMEAALVSCAEFAELEGFGSCPPGAEVAAIPPYLDMFTSSTGADAGSMVWPTADISAEALRGVPPRAMVVTTRGSTSVVEQTKTALATTFADQPPALTLAEQRALWGSARELAGFQQLVNTVIVMSLCIAGCGLAVSVVTGINDRQRPFSLLRLTGVRLETLRRVVLLETVAPLLVVAIVAVGAAFVAADLFLRSQMDYTLRAPGVAYWLALLLGLAASLALISGTLPVLARITDPKTARSE